jgi:antitoxin component YwqK of YwqJK toxin-antitoxin module
MSNKTKKMGKFKVLVTVYFLLNINFLVAQGDDLFSKKKSCTEKSELRNKNVKYAEWECGKRAGTVDCNEKLTFDEDHNTFLAGMDGTPFNGKCETCHNNGMLERTVTFVNGKENGIDSTTYESGCLQVVRAHVLGVRSGTWTYLYDTTQQMAWEMNYYLGVQHGKSIFFTKRGDTTLFEFYKNGLLHGVQRTYHPYKHSKIQKITNYTDGFLNGSFKTFNEKGIVTQDLNYKMGKKDGEFKYYFDDGTLLRTENWSLDVKDGEFKTFYYQGFVQDHVSYKKGKFTGTAEEFYPDQKLKHKIIYDKKGVRVEEYKYDEHGRETFSFGAPEGGTGAEDDTMTGQSDAKKKKSKKKKKTKKAKKTK